MDVTKLLCLVVFAAFIVALQIHTAPDLQGFLVFYPSVPLLATTFDGIIPSQDARGLRGRS
jgi:hypothetical protein